jgi:hypothetical protein
MKNLLYLAFLGVFAAFLHSCNPCKDVSCLNAGVCEDGLCNCAAGFSGDSCQIEDKCITNNVECLNEGVCEDGTCDCAKKYYGERCETHCVNGKYIKSTGICDCYPGYDDETCEIEMRLDWIADYTIASDCNGQNVQSVITAKDHPDPDSTFAVNYVSITNLTTAGDTKGYGIIMDGNKLVVPTQKVKDANGTQFTVESTSPATLNGENFVLVIKRKLDNNAVLCTLNFNRN